MPLPTPHLASGEVGIVHLSDLHVGAGGVKEVWNLCRDLLKDIRPQLLLVTGDLVDSPTAENYDKAAELLDGLADALNLGPPHRYYVCPGNHDVFPRGSNYPQAVAWLFRREPILVASAVAPATAWVMSLAGLGLWSALPLLVPFALWGIYGAATLKYKIKDDGSSIWQKFKGRLPESHVITTVALAGGWRLGLIGVDTCADADAWARGYVRPDLFPQLEAATRGQEYDLCVCLAHHHLMPIRALESGRYRDKADWGNLMYLVNGGQLLEALAKARVDLVLHGHEHEANLAGYASLEADGAPLAVIGAGSATGTTTNDGWGPDRVSFNLVVLSPDRSVRVRRYWRRGAEWQADKDVPLRGPTDLRQGRLRRAFGGHVKGAIAGGITKFVEFTRERDIWVYWYFTGIPLRRRAFERTVRNSTGAVDEISIQVSWAGHPRLVVADPEDIECERLRKADHTWQIRWTVPEEVPTDVPVDLTLSYCWLGGGLLTREELDEAAGQRALGRLRAEGFEFVVCRATEPIEYLEAVVTLPQEYSPADDKPTVFISDPSGIEHPGEVSELTRRVVELASGQFSLRIPYPRPGVDYEIAWRPVPSDAVAAGTGNALSARAFVSAARTRGEALLDAAAAPLVAAAPGGRWSLSLFVRRIDAQAFDRAAVRPVGLKHLAEDQKPAVAYEIKNCPTPLTYAWWGRVDDVFCRPDSETDVLRLGFMRGERGILCVPVRFAFRPINPPPWGVLRIAALNSEAMDLLDTNDIDTLDHVLNAGIAGLLSVAMGEDKSRV